VSLGDRKSITFRLTLLFASVSTCVLLLLAFVVGALVERHFEQLDMAILSGKLELIEHALAQVHSAPDLDRVPKQLADSLVGQHGVSVIVRRGDGENLFAAGTSFPEALLSASQADRHLVHWSHEGHHAFRGIFATVRSGIRDDAPYLVGVSTETAVHDSFMHSFQLTLWAVVACAALLSGILGWLAARRGLAPLREMRTKASEITASRLDHRLPVGALPMELAEVARTLNDMLARLEESFTRLSDFSSDLAHELRTPVANLLTQTQVTLSKQRTADEYRDILASNAEEFERLSRMMSDMLFLAKADNDLIVPHAEQVDLAAEVRQLFDFYDALAEEKGVSLACSGAGTVPGDRLMLRRAISNLLSNAIRHTPAGGHVEVVIGAADSAVGLQVRNPGETIPEEHLPRIFDRFYRVDTSRHGAAGEGAGLGLAITRAIARAHKGDAVAHSQDGVTTFELRLPM
jgi:two-component system heavy metal sensor histidine kinase CusS